MEPSQQNLFFSAISAFLLISSVNPLPTRSILKDTKDIKHSDLLANINRNFEIVEGPKEFLLPLAPLKILLGRHSQKNEGSEQGSVIGSASDLDYMVYGKVYLMKALGISNRMSISNRDSVTTESTVDAISFPPTTKKAKRTYQYKYWNTPKPSDYRDTDGFQSENRKIEIRSVDKEDKPVLVSSSVKPDTITSYGTTSSSTTTTSAPAVVEGDTDTIQLDEENLELLRRWMPQALTGDEETTGNSTNEELIPGSNSTDNGGSPIALENRFLIDVPTTCPEGQKRTHRGVCKPVFVHNPSPRDGLFAGKITAVPTRLDANNKNDTEMRGGDFQLTTLFSSFVKLEKSLEKAVQEAQQRRGQGTQPAEGKDVEGNPKKEQHAQA